MGFVAPPSPADPPSIAPVSRREGALLGLACLALAAGLLWLSRYGIDPLDEGYFAHLSQRMAAGEAIYRDFPVPYTPGAFALHSWLFQLFGVNLWVLRPLLIGVRVGLVTLLYVLGRRLMPPVWAAVAPVALMAQDPIPGIWDPHPAWYALFFYVAGVWVALRALAGQGQRWWLAAGALAGATFLFKQNMGLFLPMALAWLLLFRPAASPAVALQPGPTQARLWWAARIAFLALLVAAFLFMTLPFFSAAVALAILGPLVATAVAFAFSPAARFPGPGWGWLIQRGCLVGSGFGAVVAPAVLWLGLTGGFGSIPFAAYIGSLDQKGFYLPLSPPSMGSVLILGGLLLSALAVARLPGPRSSIAAGACLAVVSVMVLSTDQSDPDPWLRFFDATYAFGLWALPASGAAAALALGRRAGAGPTLGTWRTLLVAGVILWFNQYPRMDVPHALWSGALLWVVGAFLLWRLGLWLQSLSSERMQLLPGLLLLCPATLLYPSLYERAREFVEWQPQPPFIASRPVADLDLAPAPVAAQADLAYDLRVTAWRIRDETSAGEPIFVYPAAPIIYLLAERPNATPYAHIFPGLVSPADEGRLIAALEDRQTRLLVVDRWGVLDFLPPTELVAFQAYVERHYTLHEHVGRFDLLLRRAD